MTWKAAHPHQNRTRGAEKLAFEAKIWCSQAVVRCCADAMKVVGGRSYSNDYPLQTYMADALVLPNLDGGNVGIRRRQAQKIFLGEGYKPWAASLGAQEQEVEEKDV
jgi:nitroalkane oxidase